MAFTDIYTDIHTTIKNNLTDQFRSFAYSSNPQWIPLTPLTNLGFPAESAPY